MLKNYQVYDSITCDQAVELFGPEVTAVSDVYLDELQEKIDQELAFRKYYSKWYKDHDLETSTSSGEHTVVVKGVTGAPLNHNTPWNMYFWSPIRHIKFQQGNNYTCAFSSLCSAIYAFANGNTEIKNFATMIHDLRQPN